MTKYNKAIASLMLAVATGVFMKWGEDLGLPADWPETVTLVLSPIAVCWLANKAQS